MTKKQGFSLTVILALALSVLFVPAASAQDMDNPLAHCDPIVQALVFAAQDAYGYNFDAASASRVAPEGDAADDMTSGDDTNGDDAEATPEATGEASLMSFAKVPTGIQQDATEEPGDMAGADDGDEAQADTASQDVGPSLADCDAVRESVVAFILNANMVTGDGMDTGSANQFTVDGETITPNFHVLMSGPQEVPGPGDDDATGEGWFFIDGETNTVCWNVWVSGMNLPASAAHIHIGAEGEAGPPVVPFTEPGADGTTMGCTTAEADVVQAILANPSGYYANIHNADFPAGATRGQLLGI